MRPTHWAVQVRLRGEFTVESICTLVDQLRELNRGGLVGAVQLADGVQLELSAWAPQVGQAESMALGWVRQMCAGVEIVNVEAMTYEAASEKRG